MPLNNETVPLTRWFSRRCSGVFGCFKCIHQGSCEPRSCELRAISLFIWSRALETSSVTCSTLRFFIISFIFGSGPRSDLAIASLRVTALPITLRLAPHERQYCWPDDDSVPH